jgi:acyl-CoA synthetase (AMP-forming)/AMP-acid ligase II
VHSCASTSKPEVASIPANLDAFLENATSRFGPRTLLDYFEDGRTVTYTGFAWLVDQAANTLAAAGVAAGERVAVMLPNIPLFPVLTFALARLGAVCVPVNTRYTHSELDFIAADADVSWVIVSDELRRGVSDAEIFDRLPVGHMLRCDADGMALTPVDPLGEPRGAASPPVSLDDVTHIQYTSGTTGFPKGCLLTHRYWLTAAASYDAVGRRRRRNLDDSPYFYMSGPLLLVSTMWSGGAVVVPRDASLRRFLPWLVEQQIDWCWFPLQLLKFPPSDLDRAHNLRYASIYMAEADEVDEIEQRFGVVVRDAWSMTETGFGTYVPDDMPEMMRAQSIGIPMPLREIKIVGEDLREVPDGQVGELCIRGPGMFLGYHDRPDANAELLLDGGWFRTGDRARRDERGWLYYLGRAKDMVRRSGENISCVEVETAIRQMPEVRECAVLPVPDGWRDEEVKAYVVLADGAASASVPPEAIASWAKERLASFKVPRYIEFRNDLPHTPSDKVAKGELRDEKSDLRSDSYDRVDGMWR